VEINLHQRLEVTHGLLVLTEIAVAHEVVVIVEVVSPTFEERSVISFVVKIL
jgi:hypothetical protein